MRIRSWSDSKLNLSSHSLASSPLNHCRHRDLPPTTTLAFLQSDKILNSLPGHSAVRMFQCLLYWFFSSQNVWHHTVFCGSASALSRGLLTGFKADGSFMLSRGTLAWAFLSTHRGSFGCFFVRCDVGNEDYTN